MNLLAVLLYQSTHIKFSTVHYVNIACFFCQGCGCYRLYVVRATLNVSCVILSYVSFLYHTLFSLRQSGWPMPFCGRDRSCNTVEGRGGDVELGCPWCHKQEPWGPELSSHGPPARSRVGTVLLWIQVIHQTWTPQIKHEWFLKYLSMYYYESYLSLNWVWQVSAVAS